MSVDMEHCLLYYLYHEDDFIVIMGDPPVCASFIHVSSPIRPLTVHQAEGGDLKGQGSSDQQGLRNRREHQTGGHQPAAGLT